MTYAPGIVGGILVKIMTLAHPGQGRWDKRQIDTPVKGNGLTAGAGNLRHTTAVLSPGRIGRANGDGTFLAV